jgi:hypothetical protein
VPVELREITVHVCGRKIDFVFAAMEDHHIVSGSSELAHQERACEPRPAEHEDPLKR